LDSKGQPAPIVEYRYNRASQRTHADYENLAYSRWQYDPTFGHLDQVTHYDGDDEVLSSFEYTYDLDGLRTRVTREDGDYVEYGYDGLSRLTDEHCKNAQGQTQWRRQYQYDKVGNRTQLMKTDGATSRTYYYWYNGLGQLETMRWNVNGPEWYCRYTYDANGNLTGRTIDIEETLIQEEWTYAWDAQDRLVKVEKDDRTGAGEDVKVEYKYCQTCGGAMSERIEYASDMQTIVSWLRYEYDGLNLLRIDEKYDGETPAGLDENDPWRPLNVFIHGPGAIGQIVKCKWYNYYSDGQNPTSCCDSGEYYYFYDALGNVNGVLDDGGHYYRWEMDAFGNDLPGGHSFLDMDQPGPKEHLTGKMFDTVTGLYYFAARWYDPEVGKFVSRDCRQSSVNLYALVDNTPTLMVDPAGAEPIVIISGAPCDLMFERCSTLSGKTPDYRCCSHTKLLGQLHNAGKQRNSAVDCLAKGDPANPSCDVFVPKGTTCDEVKKTAGGVTPNDTKIPYYNANHPKMDPECGKFCVCAHEEVHAAQPKWTKHRQRTPLERAAVEQPAYQAELNCLLRMLRDHGGEMQE